MPKLVNRAYVSTATTGTGTITLGTPPAGFRSFADAGVADGDTVRYIIEDGNNWEIGTGTYTATGTTLSRTVLESSNADAAINLSGSANVYVSAVAEDIGAGDALGTVTSNDLDLSTGNFFEVTADNQTLTFSNPSAVDSFIIKVNGGGSSFDLSIASYDNVAFNVSSQETFPAAVVFKPDGTKMYITGQTSDAVHEYNLSAPWIVSTASFVQSFSVAGKETTPRGLFFDPDGTKMFITGSTSDAVHKYNLSTPWIVSTASFVQSFSVAGQETNPQGVFFKPDGTKMYIIGTTGDDVNEYTLGIPWDISTVTFVQSFSVLGQEASVGDLFFKPDGTKMFITGTSGDEVNEYTLGVPWDISTSSYVQNFSVASQDTNPNGLFFSPDGLKMYMVGFTNLTVYQYTTGASASITYPASVKWPDAAAPTVSDAGTASTIGIYTVDGGTTYYGYQLAYNQS